MDGWMSGWVDGWMSGWVDGWVDEWMSGWMDYWILILLFRKIILTRCWLSCKSGCYRFKGEYVVTLVLDWFDDLALSRLLPLSSHHLSYTTAHIHADGESLILLFTDTRLDCTFMTIIHSHLNASSSNTTNASSSSSSLSSSSSIGFADVDVYSITSRQDEWQEDPLLLPKKLTHIHLNPTSAQPYYLKPEVSSCHRLGGYPTRSQPSGDATSALEQQEGPDSWSGQKQWKPQENRDF